MRSIDQASSIRNPCAGADGLALDMREKIARLLPALNEDVSKRSRNQKFESKWV